MERKITKDDFKKYTKEEIVDILVKYPSIYHSDALIFDLQRMRENNSFKDLDNASQKVIDVLNKKINFSKLLREKYNGTVNFLKLTLEERIEFLNIEIELEKAEKEEERLEKKYNKECVLWNNKKGIK